jgi:Bacterial Ig-like domain (group 3)
MRLTFHARLVRAALLAGLVLAMSAPGAVAATTQTALGSSVPSPVWGQAVTFTATVTSTETPAGAVDFTVDGAKVAGPVVLDGAGKATFTTSSLVVGSRAVVASFTSTTGFDPSHGDLTVTVSKASVSVVETASPNPAVAGQDTTFVATVTAASPSRGAPTGKVAFFNSAGRLIVDLQELSGGRAGFSGWAGAGQYRIFAGYLGDDHFNTSTGSVDVTVNKADTATTLTASATQLAPGQSLVLTALVAVKPPGDIATYGSLQLTADGKPIGNPIPLEGDQGVRVTLTAPSVPGTYTLGVAYSGDDDTNASSAPALQVRVGASGGGAPGGGAPGGGASGGGASGGGAAMAGQLRAVGSTLISALRRRGLAALRGTPEPFTAPGAGVLEQHVDSPTPLKAAKAVRLAAGRQAFSGPGRGVLKLRLTAAGRRAIRKGKALRVAIVTTFTPSKGQPVSVVQRLTVKAKKARKVSVADPGWTVDAVRRTPRRPPVSQAPGRV